MNYEYSNRQETPFGGIEIVKRFIDKTGIIDYLQTQELPQPGSNAGYSASQIIQGFWVSVWLGANRFALTVILRFDEVIKQIFGWKRCPSDNTCQRFFRNFELEKSSNVFINIGQCFFSQLKSDHFTLDVDSSVWT